MGSGIGECAQTTREQAHRSGLESLPPPRRTNLSTPSPAGSRQLPATVVMERMGRQRAVESSTVLDQASEKVTSTRSRHDERVFEASQVRGLLMAWIGATPQLPYKRTVLFHPRLDDLLVPRMCR